MLEAFNKSAFFFVTKDFPVIMAEGASVSTTKAITCVCNRKMMTVVPNSMALCIECKQSIYAHKLCHYCSYCFSELCLHCASNNYGATRIHTISTEIQSLQLNQSTIKHIINENEIKDEESMSPVQSSHQELCPYESCNQPLIFESNATPSSLYCQSCQSKIPSRAMLYHCNNDEGCHSSVLNFCPSCIDNRNQNVAQPKGMFDRI